MELGKYVMSQLNSVRGAVTSYARGRALHEDVARPRCASRRSAFSTR